MKTRLLLLALLAVVGAAIYFGVKQPHVSKIPQRVRGQLPDLKPARPPPLELPPLVVPEIPALSPPALPPVEKKP